ncbi:MAG: AMP-binding protein, partial [Candidatus Hydrogenedentales bacterium]
MAMFNLVSILENNVRERPDKAAVVFGQFRLSYAQINMMANQLANGLRSIGIGRGDKVAFSCPNLPYFPIVWFGVLKTGATLVPMSVLLTRREIAYHLTDSESRAYICFEGTAELPMGEAGRAAFAEVESCEHFYVIPTQPGGSSPYEGVKTLMELMGAQSPECETDQCSPDDTALIIYTSGTTGQPKGAELTHSNLLTNCMVSTQLFETRENDVSMAVLPLFHSF